MHLKRGSCALGLVVAIGLMTPQTVATTLAVDNLANLIEESDRIFVGRCLSEEIEGGRIPSTKYTFSVIDPVRGVTGDTVTLRQFGLAQPRVHPDGRVQVMQVPGTPRYAPGEELLLFVVRESEIGLSSPIGLEQGAFRIKIGEDGRKTFVNAMNNRNLSRGLSDAWLRSRGLDAERSRKLTEFKGGAVDYHEFLDLVKTLTAGR